MTTKDLEHKIKKLQDRVEEELAKVEASLAKRAKQAIQEEMPITILPEIERFHHKDIDNRMKKLWKLILVLAVSFFAIELLVHVIFAWIGK